MTNTEFKAKWNIKSYESWLEYDPSILDSSNLCEKTKGFLKGGFPDSAAPFLDFELKHSDGELLNVAECYQIQVNTTNKENLIVFGSDGAGNPICIDSSAEDKIVLLDHELNLRPIELINKDVIELARFLLEFRNFISEIQVEFGQDGFFDSMFTKVHLDSLKVRFKAINPNIFKESEFWNREIKSLYEEIE